MSFSGLSFEEQSFFDREGKQIFKNDKISETKL